MDGAQPSGHADYVPQDSEGDTANQVTDEDTGPPGHWEEGGGEGEWIRGTITGHLKNWDYGFILADDGGDDVHFNSRRLPLAMRSECQDGRRVRCRLMYRQTDGKRHTRRLVVEHE